MGVMKEQEEDGLVLLQLVAGGRKADNTRWGCKARRDRGRDGITAVRPHRDRARRGDVQEGAGFQGATGTWSIVPKGSVTFGLAGPAGRLRRFAGLGSSGEHRSSRAMRSLGRH